MTTEAFRGSLPAQVLDALTTAMGTENKLGASEDARTGAPGARGRVTWVPPEKGTRSYTGTAQQRTTDLHVKHVHDVSVQFDVHLWAESYAAAEDLEIRLETALYTVFSPNAYELGPQGQQFGDNSPTGKARGWLFVIPVRLLRIPLPVEVHKTVTLQTARATSTVTDPQSGTPTSGPAPSTTYP